MTLPMVMQRGVVPGKPGSTEAYFAEWYAEYPRRVAPHAALRAYRAAVRRTGLPLADAAALILAGLRAYRFSPERQYQPHPTTWLNGGRWINDEESEIDPVLAAAGLTAADLMPRGVIEHGAD